MTTPPTHWSTTPRHFLVAVLAAAALRALYVALAWFTGAPPAYAGQHEKRLLASILIFSFLLAALMHTGSHRDSLRSRYLTRSFAAIAFVTLLASMWYDHSLPSG